MKDSSEPLEQAEEAVPDPEKADFTLEEDELKDISGAGPLSCGEIGSLSFGCTNTGT